VLINIATVGGSLIGDKILIVFFGYDAVFATDTFVNDNNVASFVRAYDHFGLI
jgi:hypothetical protein